MVQDKNTQMVLHQRQSKLEKLEKEIEDLHKWIRDDKAPHAFLPSGGRAPVILKDLERALVEIQEEILQVKRKLLDLSDTR